MKKYKNRKWKYPHIKYELKMKLATYLFLISLFQIQASTYSQNTKINLNVNDVSIAEVFELIEEKTEFKFLVATYEVDVERKVSIQKVETSISAILDDMFSGYPVSIEIVEKQILIRKKVEVPEENDEIVQQKIISGTVVDENNEPMPGASVVVKGTNNGVTTDFDGNFSLVVATEKNTLVITYVGYKTLEVEVAETKELNIIMKPSATSLNEVVVVGYGTQKKVTVTGSVSTVSGTEVLETKTANLANSLTGRVPGLVINARSGEPGSDNTDIFIRGKGTTGDNTPLYVIDGIANRGSFERLNPDDIESISVLKDASAAIYGAQAANGVIVITTKRGKIGKPTLSFNSTYSMSQATRRPELMSSVQYLTWIDEQNSRNGRPTEYQDVIRSYRNGTNDPEKWGETDWWDEVMDTWTPQVQHSLSLSGGSEDVKYHLSGQYLNQDAAYKGDAYGYKQYNIRSNIDAQISKNLKVGVDLAARVGNKTGATSDTDGLVRQIFVQTPYESPYFENGLVAKTSNGNPINAVNGNNGERNTKTKKADTKFSFTLNLPSITDGLYVSGYAAIDYYTTIRKDLSKPFDQYSYNSDTGEYINHRDQTGVIRLYQESKEELNKTFHLRMGYDKSFMKHRVSSFVAIEKYTQNGEYFSASKRDLISETLPYLDFSSDIGVSGGQGFQTARLNYFGRVNYNYDEKYLAEFSLRRDGSKLFHPDYRYGWFPGMSLGWVVSKESFFRNDFVSNLKIRASWGKLGNDKIAPDQFLQNYIVDNSYVFGETKTRTIGLIPGVSPNITTTWETAVKTNFGIDFSLDRGSFVGSIDLFHENRSDILTEKDASSPGYTGLILPDENIGEVTNKGIEFELNYRKRIKDFRYNIGGQFTYAKSNIVFIDEALNTPEWQRKTGSPVDYLLVYEADGLYQDQNDIDTYGNGAHFADAKPGDVRFVDKNEDGIIDTNDQILLENSPTPKIVYGINMGIQWKNISLSCFFQGQALSQTIYRPWDINQQSEYYTNRWVSKRTTPNAIYPAAYDMSSSSIQNTSTIWVKDNSFLRLKNLEFSYTFSERIIKQLGVQNLRWYASGHNLFLIYDNVKINDPESASSTGWYYPQQRLISTGFSLTF